jgi:hypothetical protein
VPRKPKPIRAKRKVAGQRTSPPSDFPWWIGYKVDEWPAGRRTLQQLTDEKAGWLPRLSGLYYEVVDDLLKHGIRVEGTPSCIHLAGIDLSACDAKTADIATLMVRLGLIVAQYANLEDKAYRLLPLKEGSDTGNKKKGLKSEQRRDAIRQAFAKLLDENEDRLKKSQTAIAHLIHKDLGPGPGFSEPNIRKEIRELGKEIRGSLRKLEGHRLDDTGKVKAVQKAFEGKVGVTFNTVLYFLLNSGRRPQRRGKRSED